jgi:hypothetical protein
MFIVYVLFSQSRGCFQTQTFSYKTTPRYEFLFAAIFTVQSLFTKGIKIKRELFLSFLRF